MTALEDMFKVKSALEKQGVLVQTFGRELVPKHTVKLPDSLVDSIESGLTSMSQLVDDFEKVYTNIETLS